MSSNNDFTDNQSNDGHRDDTQTEEPISESMTTVYDLNDYVMIKVFTHLTLKDRMCLKTVSHHWKYCIEESMKSEKHFNWRLVDGQYSFIERQLQKAIYPPICPLMTMCCHLKHIDFRGFFKPRKVKSSDLMAMEDIVVSIAANCYLLESIDFGDLQAFEGFESKADYYRNLKKITSRHMTESAINSLIDSEALEVLDIRFNRCIIRPEFKRLGLKFNELHLTKSRVTSEEAIEDLCCGNGKNITILSIDIRESVILSLICKSLKHLKAFKLNIYSKEINFNLFSNLNHLKTLCIVFGPQMDFSAQEVTQLFQSLNRYLTDLVIIGRNIGVNDQSLQELQQKCPFIEKLSLRNAISITSAGMQSISQLKSLKDLSLVDCICITDEIDLVLIECPLLRRLTLDGCRDITVKTIHSFIEKVNTFPKEGFYLSIYRTKAMEVVVPHFSPAFTTQHSDEIVCAFGPEFAPDVRVYCLDEVTETLEYPTNLTIR